MKIPGAQTRRLREHLQRGYVLAFFDKTACLRDHIRVVGLGGGSLGVAPFAGAKACRTGTFQRVVKLDVFGLASRDGQDGRQ